MNNINELKQNCINVLQQYNKHDEFTCCVCNIKSNSFISYSETGDVEPEKDSEDYYF